MTKVKTIDGEEVDDTRVTLAMYMIENSIARINFNYDGAGDSGEGRTQFVKHDPVTDTYSKTDALPDNIEDIALNLVWELVNPNFNNEGSYGEGFFEINDEGRLIMSCDHSDIIHSTQDTSYSEDIVDTTKI